MTLKPTLIMTLLALSLTACGGGGGDTIVLSPTTANGQGTTATNNQANNNQTTNSQNPNTGAIGANIGAKDPNKKPATTTFNTNIQGVVAQVGTTTAGLGASTATSDINTVVIGNQSIALGSNLKSGTSLSNVRYGYLTAKNTSPALIVQGLSAKQMPNTGKVTYQGNAVHLTASGGNISSQVASARFTADFDKKTLTGTIRVANPINLGATITGNRFAGMVGDFATSGYFYGEKADELGGIYKNSDGTISGAYGAKK